MKLLLTGFNPFAEVAVVNPSQRIVEVIETWGAEAVFAGVSPLSEAVVAGLERQPLMIEKDLNEAIAAAFRIAESQHQLV